MPSLKAKAGRADREGHPTGKSYANERQHPFVAFWLRAESPIDVVRAQIRYPDLRDALLAHGHPKRAECHPKPELAEWVAATPLIRAYSESGACLRAVADWPPKLGALIHQYGNASPYEFANAIPPRDRFEQADDLWWRLNAELGVVLAY